MDMVTSLCITPEERRSARRILERSKELTSYLLENPDEAEQLNGATVVFDEESFQREKSNGGKVIFAKRTFQFTQ
ncbi:MAG: hypothetical protein LBC70_05585 [Chitinispirillales bacterium]|jgi:hypothetical protein|nr:hypothetical protein [Chitinispirillales bacterium]